MIRDLLGLGGLVGRCFPGAELDYIAQNGSPDARAIEAIMATAELQTTGRIFGVAR